MAHESLAAQNAMDLERELAWFTQVLDARMSHYFRDGVESGAEEAPEALPAPPDMAEGTSPYASFVASNGLVPEERLLLVLALVPHLRPHLLDIFYVKNKTFDRKFTEFGGIFNGPDGDFMPTGETLAFLVAESDLEARFRLHGLLAADHLFARQGILLAMRRGDEPPMKARLHLSAEALDRFTTGRVRRPELGVDFPARFIETRLGWDDLVLHPGTRKQVQEIQTWLQHGSTLLNDWGMGSRLRPGFRALFHGPPGTGKTMTACLLGRYAQRDVYQVDLSLVVSKYIGETEKNLSRVFDQAQNREWILFFDEADALFGKRTETRDAHDRYANQEVAYLLQRIETFDGVVILASNRRENLDEAFARRFEAMVYFPVPRPEDRLRLWQKGFSVKARLDPRLNLDKLAREHVLAGGAILNVIRYASLEALGRGQDLILLEDVLHGIQREHEKEGKG